MMPKILTAVLVISAIAVMIALPKAINLAEAVVQSGNVEINNKPAVAGEKISIPVPKDKNLQVPFITANAIFVKDLEANQILYVKDADKRMPIASTTKIMTAIVASEYFKANDELTVFEKSLVAGSSMGLIAGEKINFRSLLYGMLLNSGNDAAFTIADNYPGGREAFILAMNKKAKDLNMINSNFDNPAGFDSVNHNSSAEDLAKVAEESMKNYQLARVVATKDTVVASIDKTKIHDLKNLNKLLNTPGVLGIKTGTTPQAKENLVGLIERNNRRILTVILGSDDRFGDTNTLIDWVFNNFSWN